MVPRKQMYFLWISTPALIVVFTRGYVSSHYHGSMVNFGRIADMTVVSYHLVGDFLLNHEYGRVMVLEKRPS